MTPLLVFTLLSGSPREEYEKRFIHFGDFVVVTERGPLAVLGSQPYLGKAMQALSVPDFYRLVGEPAFAEKYEARVRLRRGLGLPGAALILTGLAAVVVGAVARHGWTAAGGGLGAFAGVGLVVGAFFVPVPYEGPQQVRERADDYNERLRRELGLDDDAPSPGPRPPTTASLTPVLGPSFNGLVLKVGL